MEDIFSVVPEEDTIRASREVALKYFGGTNAARSSVHWAEFELSGSFIRGGISDLAIMSTRLISDPNEDPVVSEMVDHARDVGLKAGDFISAEARSGHYWCVPYMPREIMSAPSRKIRVLLITEHLFYDVLSLFNSEINLTPAERRVAYQTVIGLNPSRAAEVDCVSVETKRSQFKSAASKLECHSQSEVVRLLASQLIHLLYVCEAETSHIQLVEQFGAQVFKDLGRLSVQRLPSGRVSRVWEFGPRNGRPLVLMHGYVFPILALYAIQQLHEHGLRLVLPLRAGFLDDNAELDAYESGRLTQTHLNDIVELVQSLFTEPVPIMGHNIGGVYAILLAKEYPKIFQKFIACNVMLMKSDSSTVESFSKKFLKGFQSAARDSALYKIITVQLQKTVYRSKKLTRHFYRSLFEPCDGDIRVLDGSHGIEPAYEWFRQIALHSTCGVPSDLFVTSQRAAEILSEVQTPIVFIHGPDDPMTSVEDIRKVVASNSLSKCTVLESGGHYACASHPRAFWGAVNECLLC